MKLGIHNAKLWLSVNETDHAQGPPDAPVTLVEYGDYECPYCGRSHPIVKRIQKEMGDKLRFVFRHFPLNNVHRNASTAAQAAEAAGAQGKFWQMHDLLFAHQQDLEYGDVNHYALQIGLDPYQFESALSSEQFAKHVTGDFRGGVRSGVNGTPTFFINDVRYDGENEYEPLSSAIRAALDARVDNARGGGPTMPPDRKE
jgi:protein-disulfide isomerase